MFPSKFMVLVYFLSRLFLLRRLTRKMLKNVASKTPSQIPALAPRKSLIIILICTPSLSSNQVNLITRSPFSLPHATWHHLPFPLPTIIIKKTKEKEKVKEKGKTRLLYKIHPSRIHSVPFSSFTSSPCLLLFFLPLLLRIWTPTQSHGLLTEP